MKNLKRQYEREGVERPEEILEMIARDLNMTVAKTTLVRAVFCLSACVRVCMMCPRRHAGALLCAVHASLTGSAKTTRWCVHGM